MKVIALLYNYTQGNSLYKTFSLHIGKVILAIIIPKLVGLSTVMAGVKNCLPNNDLILRILIFNMPLSRPCLSLCIFNIMSISLS